MKDDGSDTSGPVVLTTPPIFETQQRPEMITLLQAQAVAYSKAKRARSQRLALIVAISLVTALVALVVSTPGPKIAVSVVGAVLSLAAEYIAGRRLTAQIDTAVAIQEQFDTTVFQLNWNRHLGLRLPIPANVATLAGEYAGQRFDEPWYPSTGSVHRPLDVLLCQQSNLAWGAPTHRRWAWLVAAVCSAAVLVPFGLAVSPVVNLRDYLTVGLLPWTPVIVWLFNEARDHFATARTKSDALQDVLATWKTCLSGLGGESDCREIQNEVVNSRKRNAITPDWFDERGRARNETVMKAAARAMRAEAAAHGKTDSSNPDGQIKEEQP